VTRRGLSLVELLISLTVLLVLGTAMVQIYQVAQTAFQTGGGRIAMQQRARETLRRVVPYLSSAVPASEGAQAVAVPELDNTESFVLFTSPMDWIDGTAMDPRTPTFRTYKIWFRVDDQDLTSGEKKLWLYRVSTTDPNVIEARRALGKKLENVTFKRVTENCVQIEVTAKESVRAANFQTRDVTVILKTGVQIPYYALRP